MIFSTFDDTDRSAPSEATEERARAPRQMARPRGQTDITTFVRNLVTFSRSLNIYPGRHARLAQQGEALSAAVEGLLGARRGSIVLELSSRGLCADGQALAATTGTTRLAALLRERGIRTITISRGIAEREMRLLADLLRTSYKALLCCGGVQSFLADAPHPNLEVTVVDQRGVTPVVDATEEVAETPDAASHAGQDQQDDSDTDLFVPPSLEMQAALDVDIADRLPVSASAEAPPAEKDEAEFEPEEGTGADRVAYAACDADTLAAAPENFVEAAQDVLRKALEQHDPESTIALAICELLPAARTEAEYHRRRDALCAAVTKGRFKRDLMRSALVNMLSNVTLLRFDDPENLMLELTALSRDEHLMRDILQLKGMSFEAARRIAFRFSLHEDAFELLCFLARTPLPAHLRRLMAESLLDVARRRPTDFQEWAMTRRLTGVTPEIFELLISRTGRLLDSAITSILVEGTKRERRTMIQRLVASNSERAVRLLVLGLSLGDEERDGELIEALGRIDHPLAVAALREVVLRCNMVTYRTNEAESAVAALAQSEAEDARKFLWEICSERAWMLPIYRRPLRVLAERALTGERA